MSKFVNMIGLNGHVLALDSDGTIWVRQFDVEDRPFLEWHRSVEEPEAPKLKKEKAGTCLAERPEFVSQHTWEQFKTLRKAKRKPLTTRALETITNEGLKAGLCLEDTLLKCLDKGWCGFEAEWVRNSGVSLPPKLVL